jgi:thiamine biosynthesis lipoprotein
LLGTFIELQAGGLDDASLHRAVEEAFRIVERIQTLMSVHDEASELSRVNAGAFRHPVNVSDETFAVLERGLEIARASAGAFDFTVAPILAGWGLLPAHLRRRASGNWRDVTLARGNRVRFDRPLAIDLGGIAKGFAVDAAIGSLRASGVVSGCVNAGGDLRVFGPEAWQVHLRHPRSARPLASPLSLRNAALATSSPCFTRQQWRGRAICHLIDPRRRLPVAGDVSVSIRAEECWLADALTKVVLNADPGTAARLLESHAAEALLVAA